MSLTDLVVENSASFVPEMVLAIGKRARIASRAMAKASTAQKNQALLYMAQMVRGQTETLKQANAKDLQRAKEAGPVSYTHLTLPTKRIV